MTWIDRGHPFAGTVRASRRIPFDLPRWPRVHGVDVHASGRFRTLYRAPADINQNILPVSELNPWALPHMYQTAHVRPDSPV